MTSRKLVAFTLAVVGTFLLFGCTEPSPVASSLTPEQVSVGSLAKPVPGSYELSFFDHNVQTITTLPVGNELVLHAYVQDSNGAPAQSGAVRFQFCSQGGRSLTTNPLPSAECDSAGAGAWVSLTTMKVNGGFCPGLGTGNACVNFGAVQLPRTIGFRFEYSPQGSGIAKGASPAMDFSWF